MKTLFSEAEILAKVEELGKIISNDYKDKEVILLGVLKGSFLFFADLARSIHGDIQIQFIQAESYGSSTQSSGVVKININKNIVFHGKHIIIVEDIIDTGLTLHKIIESIKLQNPLSLSVCSLLIKKNKINSIDFKLYYGFEIEDYFVIGYGLDFNEKYRCLRDIKILEN
ncbi:MAG: hypoxanthine phosphoribosyltransferase [Spirochaetia bacterium]|nr:hypoxanthine phosphoribosyltransferase [Spirochaetia bacterium]